MIKELFNVNTYCALPFHNMYVKQNGDVTFCCFQGIPTGNLFHSSINSIWHNQIAQEVRNACESDSMHINCSCLGSCPFVGRSLKLNQAIFNPDGPISLEFPLPSTHCNIGGTNPSDDEPACIMCPRNFASWRNKDDYKLDNTKFLIKACRPIIPHLKRLNVQGVAEPFWKGRAFEVLEGLGFPDYKDKITFFCFHNGTCMTPDTAERFWKFTDTSDLRWSIDAATPQTYKVIRRIDGFNAIKRNITYYNKNRDKDNHISYIHNNINTLNVAEVPLMVEFAKEVGADSLNVTSTLSWVSETRDIMVNEHNLGWFEDCLNRAREKARELNVKFTIPQQFREVANKEIGPNY